MKEKFVATSNTKRFLSGYAAVEERAASEKVFMTVEGDPGRGKTTTAEWFAINHELPFLRAKREWSTRWLVEDLLDQLAADQDRTFKDMYRSVIKILAMKAEAARNADAPFAIIIDEADHIVRSEKMMETIRDITDQVEVPVILIGMGRLFKTLTRYKQISSRVSAEVTFNPLLLEDTQKLVSERCEVEVEADLCGFLHAAAGGYARELLDGIKHIEAVGKRLGRPVTLFDMDGLVLLKDRSGKDVIVRGRS